ncbi:rod shape-determining protein MreD [Macrococcus carouselicus]|uniref:Rod shape-determining protein MreD n=1 Tax=Macrococcus carouselicus TaxID=69969 RepID=A0A9Q8CPH8_9STAP|nr:rod shape-determining protein MreD [Macrococcus carouselicus]TDM04449.1 rod shape-determining protein MreD [Macrococcus carouselicus]
MQYLIISGMAVILFYLDTLINSLMPLGPFYFTSHLFLIYLLILSVYKHPSVALVLGTVFGIASDVYFSTIYGIYTFGYIVCTMLMSRLFNVFYKDTMMMISLLIGFVLLFELLFYVIYRILYSSSSGIFYFLFYHGLPSVLINFVLIFVLFPTVLKFLNRSTY